MSQTDAIYTELSAAFDKIIYCHGSPWNQLIPQSWPPTRTTLTLLRTRQRKCRRSQSATRSTHVKSACDQLSGLWKRVRNHHRQQQRSNPKIKKATWATFCHLGWNRPALLELNMHFKSLNSHNTSAWQEYEVRDKFIQQGHLSRCVQLTLKI